MKKTLDFNWSVFQFIITYYFFCITAVQYHSKQMKYLSCQICLQTIKISFYQLKFMRKHTKDGMEHGGKQKKKRRKKNENEE